MMSKSFVPFFSGLAGGCIGAALYLSVHACYAAKTNLPSQSFDKVQAHQFELLDSSGKRTGLMTSFMTQLTGEHGSITLLPGKPIITMVGSGSTAAIDLSIIDDEASLTMRSTKNRQMNEISLQSEPSKAIISISSDDGEVIVKEAALDGRFSVLNHSKMTMNSGDKVIWQKP